MDGECYKNIHLIRGIFSQLNEIHLPVDVNDGKSKKFQSTLEKTKFMNSCDVFFEYININFTLDDKPPNWAILFYKNMVEGQELTPKSHPPAWLEAFTYYHKYKNFIFQNFTFLLERKN